MNTCKNLALRSTDPKHQVACIITNESNTRILAIGYNGGKKGGSNQRLSLESGKSGFLHAERNANEKLDYSNTDGKIYYTTLSPCYDCALSIANQQNVKKVIYLEKYCDKGLKELHDSGIETEQYTYPKDIPFGILPKKLYEQMFTSPFDRMEEILTAIERQKELDLDIPFEWIIELQDIRSNLLTRLDLLNNKLDSRMDSSLKNKDSKIGRLFM